MRFWRVPFRALRAPLRWCSASFSSITCFLTSAGRVTKAARTWLIEQLDTRQRRHIIFMTAKNFSLRRRAFCSICVSTSHRYRVKQRRNSVECATGPRSQGRGGDVRGAEFDIAVEVDIKTRYTACKLPMCSY